MAQRKKKVQPCLFPNAPLREDMAQNHMTNFNLHFCGLNCLRASPRLDNQVPYQQKQSVITQKTTVINIAYQISC